MRKDQIISADGDQTFTAMDGDVVAELEFAGYCAWFLTQCYPGHPWPVECHQSQDGSIDIRIRHWALAKFGSYCYYIDPKDITSPTTLHRLLKMGGGEILDRLGLPRNKPWDGQVPVMIDDVDIRFLKQDAVPESTGIYLPPGTLQ
jgi:hypothetical protein